MGLKDWLTTKAMARAPDHRAIVQERLGADDPVEGHTFGFPVAYKRAGGGVGGGKALTLATKALENAYKQGRHIGGDEGTIARSMALDSQGQTMLVVAARTFSGWTFGVMNTDPEPEEAWRVPREQLRAIERTGKTRQGGTIEVRLTFADDSFIDWQVSDHDAMTVGFWEAAERLGGSPGA